MIAPTTGKKVANYSECPQIPPYGLLNHLTDGICRVAGVVCTTGVACNSYDVLMCDPRNSQSYIKSRVYMNN